MNDCCEWGVPQPAVLPDPAEIAARRRGSARPSSPSGPGGPGGPASPGAPGASAPGTFAPATGGGRPGLIGPGLRGGSGFVSVRPFLRSSLTSPRTGRFGGADASLLYNGPLGNLRAVITAEISFDGGDTWAALDLDAATASGVVLVGDTIQVRLLAAGANGELEGVAIDDATYAAVSGAGTGTIPVADPAGLVVTLTQKLGGIFTVTFEVDGEEYPVTVTAASLPARHKLTGDVVNSNSATFTTFQSVPVEAGCNYMLRVSVPMVMGNNNRDGKFKVEGIPSGATVGGFWNWGPPGTNNPPAFVTGNSVAQGVFNGAAQTHVTYAYLRVSVGTTAGTLTLQHAIGSDGTFTAKAGGVVDVFKVPVRATTGDVNNSSNTTFSEVFGDVAMQAGRKYLAIVCLPVQTAASSTGLVWRWNNLGAAVAYSVGATHLGTGGAGTARLARGGTAAIHTWGDNFAVRNGIVYSLIDVGGSNITPDFEVRSEINTSQVSVKAGAALFLIDVTGSVFQLADTPGGDVTDDDNTLETVHTIPLAAGKEYALILGGGTLSSGTGVGVDVGWAGFSTAGATWHGWWAHSNNGFDQNYSGASFTSNADAVVTRTSSAATEQPVLMDASITAVATGGNALIQVRKENVAGSVAYKGLSWAALIEVQTVV